MLQSNPFPYTQGFQNASDIHLTNGDGSFSFPVLSVPLNTQYRVVLPNQPQVASPIVTVGVAPKVSVKAKRVRRTARGAMFRFSGRVTPAHDGTQVAIQRLKGAHLGDGQGHDRQAPLVERRRAIARACGCAAAARSASSPVTNDGDHVESASRSVKLRVR